MIEELNTPELDRIAREIRGKLVEMSHEAKTPHLGSSLSCVDILVAAYWTALHIDPQRLGDPERDRFILSKGHAATALYATLAYRGFFPKELLDTFNTNGGKLSEHPAPNCVPGVELATGSLGHGLPMAVGMALAQRIQGKRGRFFVLMSDGECEEGSVWEAAMFAAKHTLENIAVIVDYNKWQATGRSDEIMALASLSAKWEAFGWSSCEIDGHSMDELVERLGRVPDGSGKPIAIIAHTVKGKGISFMEDDNNWHYRIPTEEEVQSARKELGLV